MNNLHAMDMQKVLEEIRRKRLSKELTQAQVAEFLGISHAQYARIEKGISELSIERLEKLKGYLSLDPAAYEDILSVGSPASQGVSFAEYLRINTLLTECQSRADNLTSAKLSLEAALASERNKQLYRHAKSLGAYFVMRLEETSENTSTVVDWRSLITAAGFNYDALLQEWHEYRNKVLDKLFDE